MTSWKIFQFSRSPTPSSIYLQNSSTPLTWKVQFQTNTAPPPSMLSGPSFRSTFVFSINSLILSSFSLTFFHLAEASLSAFSWQYILVCVVAHIFHEISFIYNCSHF